MALSCIQSTPENASSSCAKCGQLNTNTPTTYFGNCADQALGTPHLALSTCHFLSLCNVQHQKACKLSSGDGSSSSAAAVVAVVAPAALAMYPVKLG